MFRALIEAYMGALLRGCTRASATTFLLLQVLPLLLEESARLVELDETTAEDSIIPKGPCTQIVYTLGPLYLYREYFMAKGIYYLGTWTLRVCSGFC